jgi:hypothetical protein
MANWEGYDWENIDGGWYEYGVTPVGTAYSGNCTYPEAINSPIFGDLPNGLPNGPTGQGSSGPGLTTRLAKDCGRLIPTRMNQRASS